MASNWASSFFGGLANQVVSDNEQQAKFAQQIKIEQMKKDEEYRNMVLNNSLRTTGEMAVADHAEANRRQDTASKNADAQAAQQARDRALFGDIQGATSQQPNQIASQVNGAMSNSPQMPNLSAPTDAATGNSQGMPAQQQTGAPVQGTRPSGNAPAANNTLPNGMADNQAVVPQPQPPIQTASTPQPMGQGAQSPDHPSVTNQAINNSSVNKVIGNQPAPVEDKILAANGIQLNDSQKQSIQNANSSLQALGTSPQDRQTYTQLIDDKDYKGAEDFLKTNKNAQAYNLLNGKLADGTSVAPINDSKFSPDPLQLRNPMVNIRAVAGDKNQLDNEQNRRNQDLDPANPKSGQSLLINAPRTQAANDLMALNSEESINAFINGGTGAKEKSAMSKLVSTITGEPTEISSSNDVMSHFEASMQRNMFSNTKGRVTNQEFNTFKNMITNSGQTPQGRENIINFMKAVNARQLEMANGYEQYAKVNGVFRGADEVIDKYQQANPIIDYKNYNPSDPKSMLNPMAKSFENWQLERTGQAKSSPDGTSTIDPITQQPRPDSLKTIVYSSNSSGTPAQKAANTSNDNPALNDAFKQFGL